MQTHAHMHVFMDMAPSMHAGRPAYTQAYMHMDTYGCTVSIHIHMHLIGSPLKFTNLAGTSRILLRKSAIKICGLVNA